MIDETNNNEVENVNENEINDVAETNPQENQPEAAMEAVNEPVADAADEMPATSETEVKAETEVEVKVETEVENKIETETETAEMPAEPVVAEAVPEKIELLSEPVEARKEILPGEFNWDAVGKKHDAYTQSERTQLEELYDKTLSSIVEQEVVEGSVVGMNNREVVVNIGFKSDGVIALSEFRYNPDLKLGDKVEVYVESQENNTGQLLLSHKKAKLLKAWDRVNDALEKDEIINGFVKCRTKGGLIVDVFGIEAFLPGSQIDVKPIRDYDVFVGKTMEFKVVKVNHEYKNVVVSHKALIEDELEQQKAEIIAKLEKGQVLEGTVKNITSYGVFIDLGGVDGLIHITDLSWGRINHPEEIVQLDQKINVVILDFDESKKRIALGLKQLTPHPWESLDANLKIGDKVTGKVVVIADYGAFVEINKGVEGLIHVSEMSWSQHLRSAQDFLKVGDEIEAVILTIDREERKMSLGIKQLIPDPWADIITKYPVNSKHTATVRNFTNFGIFVELEEGVDGLIHISDLSWSKKIKHPAEFTKIGEKIEVVVLEVDAENRRLSLGHKQLEENPWDVFETIFTIDSVHRGTIVNMADKGAIVSLPYGVEGFAPTRHLVKEDNSNARTEETLDFKVIEFNKDNKKIIVSHTKIFQDKVASDKVRETTEKKKGEKSTKKAVKKIKDNLEKTTLGDIQALADLKTEMDLGIKTAAKKAKKETPAVAKAEEAVEDKPVAETPLDEVAAQEETPLVAEAEISQEKPVEETPVAEKPAEEPEAEKPAEEVPPAEEARTEDPAEESKAEEPPSEA